MAGVAKRKVRQAVMTCWKSFAMHSPLPTAQYQSEMHVQTGNAQKADDLR
jgi:hypothetical protein